MITDLLASTISEDVRAFYDTYYDALDSNDFAAWPDFFAEDCSYRIIPRENYERGFRLATVGAESRGMLIDRVRAITSTMVFAPRYYRRFPGPLRIAAAQGGEISCEHNLLIVQTLIDKPSEILMTARCHDRLAVDDGRLLFRVRDVVFDSELVPNSLIYPA